MYERQIFGWKDSPTCANYALKRTTTDNSDKFPKATQSVQTNFYMDDYLESSPTAEEGTQKGKDFVELLSLGGFNILKFLSNDPNILQQIEPNAERQTDDGKQLPTTEESSHVLGLKWNHDSDTLVVSRGTSPETNRTGTQQVVLSLVSAVYDPIGLVAPYTMKTRLLLKDK